MTDENFRQFHDEADQDLQTILTLLVEYVAPRY